MERNRRFRAFPQFFLRKRQSAKRTKNLVLVRCPLEDPPPTPNPWKPDGVSLVAGPIAVVVLGSVLGKSGPFSNA